MILADQPKLVIFGKEISRSMWGIFSLDEVASAFGCLPSQSPLRWVHSGDCPHKESDPSPGLKLEHDYLSYGIHYCGPRETLLQYAAWVSGSFYAEVTSALDELDQEKAQIDALNEKLKAANEAFIIEFNKQKSIRPARNQSCIALASAFAKKETGIDPVEYGWMERERGLSCSGAPWLTLADISDRLDISVEEVTCRLRKAELIKRAVTIFLVPNWRATKAGRKLLKGQVGPAAFVLDKAQWSEKVVFLI